MSRLAVSLLAMPVIAISLLLAGRALVWCGGDRTDTAGTGVGTEAGAAGGAGGTGGGTGPRPEAAAGKGAGPTEASGTAGGSDASGPHQDRTDRIAGGIDPGAPDYRALEGWPGLAEAELRFGREVEDPKWAKQAEIRLLSMISELDDLALSRLEAECRESMCRLLLVYPPGAEPVYTIRQIYERIDAIGFGPAVAETRAEGGDVETLRLFLRRRAAVSSRR